MDDKQSTFEAFGTLFEGYVRNLKGSQSPEQRADLLVGMIVLIKEIDRLIADEYSSLPTSARETQVSSTSRSNNPINIHTYQPQAAAWQIVVLRQKGYGK